MDQRSVEPRSICKKSILTAEDRRNVQNPITISAFYKFAAIDDCAALRDELQAFAGARSIKGTILVAGEGINATVSRTDADIAALLAHLRDDARFSDLVSKQSYASEHPFKRLKVKIKPEIVTIGAPGGQSRAPCRDLCCAARLERAYPRSGGRSY